MVFFSLHVFVTSKQHVTARERCAGEIEYECFLSGCPEDYYYTLYPLIVNDDQQAATISVNYLFLISPPCFGQRHCLKHVGLIRNK